PDGPIWAVAGAGCATIDAVVTDLAGERGARARGAGEKNGGDADEGRHGREPTHRHDSPSHHSHGTLRVSDGTTRAPADIARSATTTSPASHPRQPTARCLLNSD